MTDLYQCLVTFKCPHWSYISMLTDYILESRNTFKGISHLHFSRITQSVKLAIKKFLNLYSEHCSNISSKTVFNKN